MGKWTYEILKEEALKYWQDAKTAGGGSDLLDKKITDKKLND